MGKEAVAYGAGAGWQVRVVGALGEIRGGWRGKSPIIDLFITNRGGRGWKHRTPNIEVESMKK
jgi:hypothetical protein